MNNPPRIVVDQSVEEAMDYGELFARVGTLKEKMLIGVCVELPWTFRNHKQRSASEEGARWRE